MDDDEHLASVLRRAIHESVHPAPPVSKEPGVTLTRWRVVEILPARTRHCVGWTGSEGRVSSSICEYNRSTHTAVSQSGRCYTLAGPPGRDPDAEWVLALWARAQGAAGLRDVSVEYAAFELHGLEEEAVVEESGSTWEELVGPCILSADVATRLALTRAQVATLASQRRLLRVTTGDGTEVFPAWQFEYPGLPDILKLFPEASIDGWTVVAWLRTCDPELGEPPLDALGRGEAVRVQVVARRAAQSLSD